MSEGCRRNSIAISAVHLAVLEVGTQMMEIIGFIVLGVVIYWFCFRDPPPPSDEFKDNTDKLNGGLM